MADELPTTAAEINAQLRELLVEEESLDVAQIDGHHYLALALPEGKAVTFKCTDSEGRRSATGDFFGAYNNGARLVVEGNAGRFAADSMVSGELIINGSAGKGLAYNLQGGTVVVRGDVGDNVAAPLAEGRVVIDGNVGANAGVRMAGGEIYITGDAGLNLAQGMTGGVIYIAGALPGLDDSVQLSRPSAAQRNRITGLLREFAIDPEGLSFHQITPSPKSKTAKKPKQVKAQPVEEAIIDAEPDDVEAEEDEGELLEAELEEKENDEENGEKAKPEEGKVADKKPAKSKSKADTPGANKLAALRDEVKGGNK